MIGDRIEHNGSGGESPHGGQPYGFTSGTATVLTSIVSTAMNLPIVRRHIAVKNIMREIVVATVLLTIAGITILLLRKMADAIGDSIAL